MKAIIGAGVAIAAVVLLASQASAQSAWVWWTATGNSSLEPVAAYTTKQECESALSVYEEKRKPLYQGDRVGRMLEGNRLSVIVSVDGKEFIAVHWCLPDTIDPRGPKGK